MNKFIFPILTSSILLSGCIGGTNIKSVSDFQREPLVKASVMPTKAQLSGAKIRVIVFDADDSNVGLAKSSKIGSAISNKVENLLSETGVEIVDRKLAAKLQKEIQLAELKGRRDYKGPEVADFSITGKVVTANFTQTYSAASNWVDDKGKSHYTPPSCKYSVSVEATLKVHALPSLQPVDTITITDTESKSQDLDGHSYRHYYKSHTCPKYNKVQLDSLVIAAGSDAVYESKVQLQNNFAARGYITEHRAKEGKHIFKITMGKQAGVKEGQEVDIIQVFINDNQLTGEASMEESKLMEGEVSNQIGNNYAWITISDEILAKRVRLGDVVKVRFTDSMLDQFKKIL
ncbi:hypothetical protein MNBD_GAMMA08-595 [hydrothermal vent metagenome]|uniref:Uncharacterized protein n=1 Tax=hydrothermal vent metagenome TaxID=652676 RepID=A0A3B0XC36_9ZZZZ